MSADHCSELDSLGGEYRSRGSRRLAVALRRASQSLSRPFAALFRCSSWVCADTRDQVDECFKTTVDEELGLVLANRVSAVRV